MVAMRLDQVHLTTRAKGRIERSFDTAQDRLVKGMRVAAVKTLAQANQHLATEFLPWWNQTLAVEPATAEDAHRSLSKRYDLGGILSCVETRQVKPDYTIQVDCRKYQIERKSVCAGLRGADVRTEKRLDGSIAVRFRDRYLPVTLCPEALKQTAAAPTKQTSPARCGFRRRRTLFRREAEQYSGLKPNTIGA
jgi:hypothetical protein